VSEPALRLATPLDALNAALDTQDEVVLSGCAGTGKTTLVRQLLDRENVALCAPTAKAAQRLKEVCKRPAMTVHSLIYGAPTEQWVKADGEVCKGWAEEVACSVCSGTGQVGDQVLVRAPAPLFFEVAPTTEAAPPCPSCGGTGKAEVQHPSPGCPGCACSSRLVFASDRPLEDIDLVVVDEASMIGAELARDIRGCIPPGTKVLWVGDPAQLPPVGDDPGVELHRPDVLLDHVYRADGGILALATAIRRAQSFADLNAAIRTAHADVDVRTDGIGGLADWRAGRSRRMAIVHTNRQRVEANRWVRETLKRAGPLVRGDRIIVRKNVRQVPVWNGEVYVVQSTEKVVGDPGMFAGQAEAETFTIVRATLDAVDNPTTIRFVVSEKHLADLDPAEFGRDTPALGRAFRPLAAVEHHDDCTFFTGLCDDCSPKCRPGPLTGLHLVNAQHGFVITCHASQGSEAEEVGVLWTPRTHGDRFADARAWLYTACTRARRSLSIWVDG
jgi:hypothetical protein